MAPRDDRLLATLKAAEPRGPKGLAKADPGAALALAAHCCMLECGFQVSVPGGADSDQQRQTQASPPKGWELQFPDEWVFEYVHPSKLGRFTLHCSLQRVSGRMLVSAMEAGAPGNHHLLGLQLPNYVPGGAASLSSGDWVGVVARQGPLFGMVEEHIVTPLMAMASDLPTSAPSEPLMQAAGKGSAEPRPRGWLTLPPPGSPERAYVLGAAVAVGAALAAGAVVVARRRRAAGAQPLLGWWL